MRNRAKCKLCQDVIESYHATDMVVCKCTEIYVDGGTAMKCGAGDWQNFLRVDNEGNEIIPVIKDANVKPLYIEYPKPSLEDKLKMLEDMIKGYESLSTAGLSAFATNYDLLSVLMLLLSILRED